ncbi:hypothetical protein IG193_04675 [Infirmifilum lucidum]|uniref:Uncharacterized protein n=1 Tax=Infirmifilum lucidum TaxID=2776706 RepID=A0A7L9FE71_9CREN|nr:hypothetical protein [Infirmifilum lucidum]QOJ78090.1 hypothetical protein IG193_04675 [Infirmifilum lucidum]
MGSKYLGYFKVALGAVTIIALAISAYYAYKVFAYIMNWEAGSQQTYTSYMTILIYVLFILTSFFLIYETLRRGYEQRS